VRGAHGVLVAHRGRHLDLSQVLVTLFSTLIGPVWVVSDAATSVMAEELQG
jgi:hypothetical protein